MNKKALKVASVVALAATLTACGKTKTVEKKVEWTEAEKIQWATENGYVQAEVEDTRPELEVSFGDAMSAIDAPYLQNYIGAVNDQGVESYGEKKDLLVFYGTSECGTCAQKKPIVNQWVQESGNKVYYFNPDESVALAAIKKATMKKLGSTDGVSLIGPLLIAYVDGEYVSAMQAGDMTDADAIEAWVSQYFKTDAGDKTATTKEFSTLAELRTEIAAGEQFIMYATRFNCPWCRKLADTARDNGINRLMRTYTGNFNTITSEKVQLEYENVWVKEVEGELTIAEAGDTDAVNAWTWLYAQDNGALPDTVNEGAAVPSYWPNTTTAVQKAEVLLYLVATGEVAPHVTNGEITAADQVAFLKEVAEYAANTDAKKFTATDRNIPAFIAVGWTEEQEEANKTAITAIVSRRSSMVEVDFENDEVKISEVNANRALFPEYFTGATSGALYKTNPDGSYVRDENNNLVPADKTPQIEVDAAFYYLTMWVNSWTYDAE